MWKILHEFELEMRQVERSIPVLATLLQNLKLKKLQGLLPRIVGQTMATTGRRSVSRVNIRSHI